MGPEIVVIAEVAEDRVQPVTRELWACARQIGRDGPAAPRLVVVGEEVAAAAAAIARELGGDAQAVCVAGLREFNGDAWRRVLETVLGKTRPRYILAAHSSRGLDFAPGLASRLGAACITGVEAVAMEDGRPVFTRAVFGGRFAARVTAGAETTVITVLPGAFRADAAPAETAAVVDTVRLQAPESRSRTTGVLRPEAVEGGIEEADVVVAAGRGIGEAERLELIRRLAALFPKSAVAGSRIVCDLGWLEYRRQVGVTGRTVSPRLYFACGVSGAIQHVMGMRGAGFVVAVNTDPGAPIFREADVGVVDDLAGFIPAFIEAAAEAS
jgi:electron transfer flavoprotein alpha subunit